MKRNGKLFTLPLYVHALDKSFVINVDKLIKSLAMNLIFRDMYSKSKYFLILQ